MAILLIILKKRKNIGVINNELVFKYEYEHSSWGSYGSETRIKVGSIEEFRRR